MVLEYTDATRKLVLENGREFYGYGFGAARDQVQEIVFNTSMVGYQEIATDPSYTDQIIVMSYPLIGNYGITDEDNESKMPLMGGMVVREYNDMPSNFRYTKTLSEMLEENGIPGISGVDTRMITRILRDEGSQRAMITDAATPKETALTAIKAYTLPTDGVRRVTSKKKWYSRTANPNYSVVAIDCGIKLSFVRKFNEKGANVTVVPYDTPASEILALNPDGVFISNGPGNPRDAGPAIETATALIGKLPVTGIGLGHQIIALACGADMVKLKHGHHGGNHPVKNLKTGRIEIVSQNHSYAVDKKSLERTGLTVTHINLLDETVSGIEHTENHLFSVQYHPDSSPGPEGSVNLFDQIVGLMAEWRVNHAKA